MIKNQQSFFIVQKIYYRLDPRDEKPLMRALLEKNLCHASEKMVKQKCLAILNEVSGSKAKSGGSDSPSDFAQRQVSHLSPHSHK